MVEHIADCIVQHKGALLTGPAGTGKSTLLKALLVVIKKKMVGKQIVMALRHCAAMLVQGKTIQHYLCKYRAKGGAPPPGTIIAVEEWSEVQLHTWMELARWKLVGVIFLLLGDADGQRKPSFDLWYDAMQQHDIRQSRLIWDLCGGLRINLTKNRRGTDAELFDRYTRMYKHADVNEMLAKYVDAGIKTYSYNNLGLDCEHFFVVSHRHRIAINRHINYLLAERKDRVMFLQAASKCHGVTMQPQNMILWVGIELLCCARRYMKNSPVSGAVYVVQSWDAKHVIVRLHADYKGEKLVADDEPEDVEDEGEEDPEASDAEALEEDALEEDAPGQTSDVRSGDVYKLTHARCAELLRPQHALVYASIQGRTMRDKHITLMDLSHEHMSMRDLITAMSRPTRGEFLHFMSDDEQTKILKDCSELSEEDLRQRAVAIDNRPPSDRPDPSRYL